MLWMFNHSWRPCFVVWVLNSFCCRFCVSRNRKSLLTNQKVERGRIIRQCVCICVCVCARRQLLLLITICNWEVFTHSHSFSRLMMNDFFLVDCLLNMCVCARVNQDVLFRVFFQVIQSRAKDTAPRLKRRKKHRGDSVSRPVDSHLNFGRRRTKMINGLEPIRTIYLVSSFFFSIFFLLSSVIHYPSVYVLRYSSHVSEVFDVRRRSTGRY